MFVSNIFVADDFGNV